MQSAISQANDAQQQLDDLLAKPDAADIAAAEAQVAGAQTKLDNLLDGADDLEVESATIKLQTALVTLGEARKDLAKAAVVAPITGSVLTINAGGGQRRTQRRRGGDPGRSGAALKLAVNVAEVDVNKVALGQPVDISVDAQPGKRFAGVVTQHRPGQQRRRQCGQLRGDDCARRRPDRRAARHDRRGPLRRCGDCRRLARADHVDSGRRRRGDASGRAARA